MNRTESKSKKCDNPIIGASFLSQRTFWWLKGIFKTGWHRPIEEDEIYTTLPEHECETITAKFTKLWDEERVKKNPSMLRVFTKAYGKQVLGWGLLFSFVETIVRVGQPLSLGGLVSYFAPGQTDISKDEAYLYAAGIIICSLLPVLAFHPFILYIFQIGMKARIGASALLYKKTLKLSKSTSYDGLGGQVINLLSNDVGKFDIALCFIHDLWKGPVEAVFLGYFIYREIGVSGIIGMAFVLGFIPFQAWIGKKAAQFRLRTAKRTDVRVRFMNEIIQGIQVIKMYTWEKSFALMVDKIRKKEINMIRGSSYIRAAICSLNLISRFAIFLSLVSYVYFGNVITARKVFIVSSFYNILNLSMVHFWPLAITCCAEAYVSIKRIQKFLLVSEIKPQCIEDDAEKSEKSNGKLKTNNVEDEDKNYYKKNYRNELVEEISELLARRTVDESCDQKGIIFRNATAAWSLEEPKITGIQSINLEVHSKKLCSIIGQVGSGKSTLLQVIIGELDLDEGSIEINGKLSYAGQEPWLYESSIRNNILFVEEYDEKRYNEVCKVCALERDFDLLPSGDATICGERGISLSGGQKARVNLARAIYKKADIYLLDDPLSAVDTHVGKHIFEKCIRDFLKDKVCILVTHQLQYLKDVEHIVLMNGGKIEDQDTFRAMKAKKGDSILHFSPDESGDAEENRSVKDFETATEAAVKEALDDPELEKEKQEIGSVKFSVYKTFVKAVNSYFLVFFVFIIFIISQVLMSGVDYFISQWVNWETSLTPLNDTAIERILNATEVDLPETNFTITDFNLNTTNSAHQLIEETRQYYITVYTTLVAIVCVIVIYRAIAFFNLCLKASINLHGLLFRGITRSVMYFFNNNPSGRILNRFSKDIGAVDSQLPMALIDCITFFLELFAIMILVAVIDPFLLIPTFVMSVLFYILRTIYMRTSRSIKRIESLTRSPIYTHTNATLQGLSTIRAYKAEEILIKEFDKHMDLNTSAWFVYITTTRAFAFWLDLVCVLYISIVTLSFLVLEGDNLGGNVGLAITQVVGLIGMCQWGMRQTAELENQMTSVERIIEYAELPSEPPLETLPKYRPQKNWPEFGAIAFNNLSLRYSETSEFVLKDLNLKIDPMEKIGIVGRTGAGKSSIIQALFGLANTEGTILIDSIDTKTLGLHDLRSKLAIIPQDPILFSGSLRSNLDPFEEKTDEDLWSALSQVELKQAVSSLGGGLDCKMSDQGSNFSMGQRQLVCLARAILRNNKILILDEATANVDPETDKLIQKALRTKFADCTVLTIAHRLHTVMDSDRVLVMDAGRIVEFAHPFELLQRPGGHLKKLIDQTGGATANLLTGIAEESYQHRKPRKGSNASNGY